MRHFVLVPFLCAAALVLSVKPAAAQFIGTFSWQTQPYCNVVTLNVTQAGTDFMLEGYDNQCGADRRAPVTGTATINPNGTVGLGLAIVNTPGGEPTHLDVVVNLQTLGGAWTNSGGDFGNFVFNGAAAGDVRPAGAVKLRTFSSTAGSVVIGERTHGTAAAPAAVAGGDTLLRLEARGYDGTSFTSNARAFISMSASETWTPAAHGTVMDFVSTPVGSTQPILRMRISGNGNVGIGPQPAPVQPLDVVGNVRIGAIGFLTGCVEDRDGTVIAGACASDARFKRDVTSFEPMLGKVAALRPVHFYWRADDFPGRAFGAHQSYGLMAQEVEEVLPELVSTDAEGFKAVNYSKLPLIALQAIRELKEKNDALESQNAEFERRLAELEARLKQ